MSSETYTPGHSQNATDFMSRRTLESHGGFFLDLLQPDSTVLDCGCGPGTITLGIAQRVAPGMVHGVDAGESQIEQAKKNAAERRLRNVKFRTASCYALPFDDVSFDCVFSHALMEHLAEPQKAVAEFHRVLRLGGHIGLCSPDWGGFLLAPHSDALAAAIEAYRTLQRRNGGDVEVGRKLGVYLEKAGFKNIALSARYECYTDRKFIGEYLALQLKNDGQATHAQTLLDWSQTEGSLFAQSWVSAVGRK